MQQKPQLSVRIVYDSPKTKHPKDKKKTKYDVALFIESKFHLLQRFTKYVTPLLYQQIRRQLRKGYVDDRALGNYVSDRFKEYIIDRKSGIVTKASVIRKSPSFIDTGGYYLSVEAKVKVLGRRKNANARIHK